MVPTAGSTQHPALIPESSARAGNDPIFLLHGEATARAKAGEAIVNATLGVLMEDDGTLAFMSTAGEAVARIGAKQAAVYAPIAGPPAYREAVVADLLDDETLRSSAVAIATPGSTGAIHHAFVNFLEPGQAALAPSYYWGPYATIADHARRDLDLFRMFDQEGRFDLEAFEQGMQRSLDRQGRAMALFNFPCNNPTGYSLDEDEWRETASIVSRLGATAPVTLVVDHAYARFGSEEANRWVDHLPTMLETATVLVGWTISKAYTQYGARVGALVALHRDGDERERIANALSYSCRATWSNCNHLGMLAATTLLTDPDLAPRSTAERRELIGLLDKRVATFNREAAKVGLRYPRYEGGFFVSVFTPDSEVTAAAMRDAGVFVVPIDGAVRVALCSTPSESVPRLVEALDKGVRAAEAGHGS